MKIIYSPTFLKKYRKSIKEIKELAKDKEIIFRKNPFDPKLKVHKLHDQLSGLWSFSLNIKYRIIFEFENPELIIFHTIGLHDIHEQ